MTDKNTTTNDSNPVTDGMRDVVRLSFMADQLYDEVISKLNIPADDVMFKNLMAASLRRLSKDHMIFAIWNNLTDDEAVHLREFLKQTEVTAPLLSVDDVVLEFSMLYPELERKVFASLSKFFLDYIKKFNELGQ